jgi:hypothetical protein
LRLASAFSLGGSPAVAGAVNGVRTIRSPKRIERLFGRLAPVDDLSPEQAEIVRRSITMLPPQAPSGLSRERALAILGQLVRVQRELWRR